MSGPPPGPPPRPRRVPSDPDEAKRHVDAVTELVEGTIRRASSFTEQERRQAVNGEWSTIESLRHVVFVIDVWLGRNIKGEQDPFHPIGMPPHFVPRVLPGSSIDADADPSFEDACGVLRGRLSALGAFVDSLSPDELAREIATHAKNVAGALGVIFDELHAHNFFINRDLDVIEKARA